MPMHLVIDLQGRIMGAGPLIRRLLGDAQSFQDVFALDMPSLKNGSEGDIISALESGRRVLVRVRGYDKLMLRGHGVRIGDETLLLNFGFGMTLPHAIISFALNEADFSPSDHVIELLFLYQASQAIMGEISRANIALEHERREAERISVTDTLTGLLNRRGFLVECGKLAAAGNNPQYAIAALDLDLFKEVNDRLGHAAGDEVLVAVAEAIRLGVRRGDVVGRVGGDEFLILFGGLASQPGLLGILQRIIERIEVPILLGSGTARLSASVGVARFAMSFDCDLGREIARADAALYRAKAMGGGRVILADRG
ncbi:diguanylate cyclase (GGDEF) domain-containing protein [Paracoccus halophilus]|nr:diguanylate cyclase (GGDEF) domain-containing protein [Paracoccus halophilus]